MNIKNVRHCDSKTIYINIFNLNKTYSGLLNTSSKVQADRSLTQRSYQGRELRQLIKYELLTAVSHRLIGGPTEEVEVQDGSHGKPRLTDGAFSFNISYTSGAIALAWTTMRHLSIGIDIEAHRHVRGMQTLACSHFDENERNWLWKVHRATEASASRSFLELWTRHEAAVKACGTGLLKSERVGSVLNQDSDFWDTTINKVNVRGVALPMPPGYVGSVAWCTDNAPLLVPHLVVSTDFYQGPTRPYQKASLKTANLGFGVFPMR